MIVSIETLISFICPPAGIVMGYKSLLKEKFCCKTVAFCFALFMAAFAYSYIPYGGTDLIRYFDYVDQLKGLSFGEAIGQGLRGESHLTVFAAMCWLIGKTGDSHLLPAITVFVIYFIGIYVTCVVAGDMKVSPDVLAMYITFILFCSNFYAITNNIRNVFSFTIVGFATFRDCYQNKRNLWTLLMYIIPIFIHSSAFVMILLRVVIILTGRLKIVSSLLIIAVKPTVDLAYSLIDSISGSSVIILAIRDVIKRAYMYFNDTNSAWGLVVQNSGSQRAMRYFYIALAVVICINIAVLSKEKVWEKVAANVRICNYNVRIKRVVDYAFNIGLMTIACAPMLTPEYWRFASALILFSGPVYFIGNDLFEGRLYTLFNNSIFIIMIPCMLLWMRELRTTDLTVLFLKPFISSPFVVFFKDIINLITGV